MLIPPKIGVLCKSFSRGAKPFVWGPERAETAKPNCVLNY